MQWFSYLHILRWKSFKHAGILFGWCEPARAPQSAACEVSDSIWCATRRSDSYGPPGQCSRAALAEEAVDARAVSRHCWKSHCSLTSPLSQAWRCCSQTCLCYSELSIGDRRVAKHGRAVPFHSLEARGRTWTSACLFCLRGHQNKSNCAYYYY